MSYRKMIQNGVGITLATLLLINCAGPTATPVSEVPTALPASEATTAPSASENPPTASGAETGPTETANFPAQGTSLWEDVTLATIGDTKEWTNKVELADLNGDGWVDILFANGGNYATPGQPVLSRVFLNRGPDQKFEEATQKILGSAPMLARVIKVRDVNNDQRLDILVGTTFQTQSRLYLGDDSGNFTEVTETHLPKIPASIGDLEFGDVDEDGDLDIVLADWGPGSPMSNEGGRTMLWLNDGTGHFSDATATNMPDVWVKFSWELEFIDADNDYDLDVLISCKKCKGSFMFENNGMGMFTDVSKDSLPQFSNNYDFEAMDVNGDDYLDLVTINDGFIFAEHLFLNDQKGNFKDATKELWPFKDNSGCDDNMHVFFDFDSDGDADLLTGSLNCQDRLFENNGSGRLQRINFIRGDTPGTLGIAVADLNGDHRIDVVQAQGEVAFPDKVYFGRNNQPDTAPPVITLLEEVNTSALDVPLQIRARIHDHKSPTMPHDWTSIVLKLMVDGKIQEIPMQWYGEYLWRGVIDRVDGDFSYQVCASDTAGNSACAP